MGRDDDDELNLFLLKLKENRPNKEQLGQYHSLVKTVNVIWKSGLVKVKYHGSFLQYNRRLLNKYMRHTDKHFVMTSFERKLKHFQMQVVKTTHGPNAVKKWMFK